MPQESLFLEEGSVEEKRRIYEIDIAALGRVMEWLRCWTECMSIVVSLSKLDTRRLWVSLLLAENQLPNHFLDRGY
jgi:hypothetical protein